MTGREALAELLERIGASRDGVIIVSELEVRSWPRTAVAAFKSAALLAPASPAISVVCPGCEHQCVMPVHHDPAGTFVVCDKRDDINRVEVPSGRLNGWQASGEAVAAFLAGLLAIRRSPSGLDRKMRWNVGVLRGRRAANVDLTSNGALVLELAGHSVPLTEVLSVKGTALALDKQRLLECVDNAASGGGSRESGARRAARLAAEFDHLKDQGVPNPRLVLARQEGRSVETIKKLLARGRRQRVASADAKGKAR